MLFLPRFPPCSVSFRLCRPCSLGVPLSLCQSRSSRDSLPYVSVLIRSVANLLCLFVRSFVVFSVLLPLVAVSSFRIVCKFLLSRLVIVTSYVLLSQSARARVVVTLLLLVATAVVVTRFLSNQTASVLHIKSFETLVVDAVAHFCSRFSTTPRRFEEGANT